MENAFNITELHNLFLEERLIEKFNLFENTRNLEKFTKKWATSLMTPLVPYDLERSGVKRGKYLSREPKKKADKFCHYFEEDELVAVLDYIDNYDLPASFIVFENLSQLKQRVYKFDIEKKLELIIDKSYNAIVGLESSCRIYKNGNYIIENYIHNGDNKIEINREHKDSRMFSNLDFFPSNIYTSQFFLKYNNNNILEIEWNATPDRSFRKVFPIS